VRRAQRMQVKQITNEKLGESVFCARHESGLEIRVMPKAGYTSAYAVFGVKYGSIDTAVKNENGEEIEVKKTKKIIQYTNVEKDILEAGYEVYIAPKTSVEILVMRSNSTINKQTDNKILNDFVWNGNGFYLSMENQFNFKNLYDLCINNSLTPASELATGGHDAQNQFKTGKAAFYVNGSWEYSAVSEAVPNATMIPYYAGVEGEEKAGLNCGTENCWAVNSKVSEADQQATIDFMVWLVSDSYAAGKMVEQLGVLPYKNAPESANGFLADAAKYTDEGCYVMDWATNYQPNVDEYRAGLVSALNQYNADQSDANWANVETAFVQGWATQYAAVNN
jgi:hypothetical protein